MKITQNFKDKLVNAQKDGKKRVYRIVGAYKATTYCCFHNIADLLNDKTGYDYGCGRPSNYAGMWTGHSNTREVEWNDIMFSAVHACY